MSLDSCLLRLQEQQKLVLEPEVTISELHLEFHRTFKPRAAQLHATLCIFIVSFHVLIVFLLPGSLHTQTDNASEAGGLLSVARVEQLGIDPRTPPLSP